MRVDGLPDWLAAAAERSLNAVHDHIPAHESQAVKQELLSVVANRLLNGYEVHAVSFEADETVAIVLRPRASVPVWDVALLPPNLSAPVDRWFAADVAEAREEVARWMEGVPVEALTWGDLDLKGRIEDLLGERLPGWRISLMVRNGLGERVALELSFTPEQPLTLAVTSRINSSSIPLMLHSNLKDDLLKGFAPVIGIPVPWLERHREDFLEMSRGLLKEESLVEMVKAEPEIALKTGTVSELDIDLESRRYAAWVWMGVYAGADDRYPEIGLHLGRRALIVSGWELELYTELILEINDWDLESRLGARWSPWRNVWLGGEWSSYEDTWWLRASIEPRIRRPYAWIRQSVDGETNGALGYRINDFLSIEAHYDSRSDDPWNVRALVNL